MKSTLEIRGTAGTVEKAGNTTVRVDRTDVEGRFVRQETYTARTGDGKVSPEFRRAADARAWAERHAGAEGSRK
ncbi:MAG: hypothetical protein IPK82_20095 [Polyangiaceae bacterium]|nr:hypothetical protein [Polyangiaceae bacterium]